MTLLAALRCSTRQAHERLEERMDAQRRCRNLASYTSLLQDLRSVYSPQEQALSRQALTATVVPDWQQRKKTGWLDDDLANLPATCNDMKAAAREPVPLRSAEDILGCTYVMEGATLGGELLARLVGPAPHRFFSSYGDSRGAMWRVFRHQADALEARGCDTEQVSAAANAMFAAFEQSCT